MHKDFDQWNKLKHKVNKRNIFPDFKSREVWWCNLGLNVGSEQDGGGKKYERPVLIIRKFSRSTFLCFPITSRNKTGSYYFKIDDKNTAILCQPRLIDSRRLSRKVDLSELSRKDFKEIINNFKNLL